MEHDDKVQFERKVTNNSGTPQISIPAEMMEYLDLEIGDTIKLQAEKGKHGKFSSLWNPDQQDSDPE